MHTPLAMETPSYYKLFTFRVREDPCNPAQRRKNTPFTVAWKMGSKEPCSYHCKKRLKVGGG